MDGKRFKLDSSFLHTKCAARRLDGGVNRISQLPEEMIVVILSFLPLRDAVRTSILSSRWLDLWKHTPHIKFDRISQLPDQVIVFILSSLTLNNAAATSALSSRWSSMWKHTPNLKFSRSLLSYEMSIKESLREGSSWDVERSKYVEIIDSVFQSCKANYLKEFSINLYMNKSAQLKLAKWLRFVFLREVERLELHFNCHDQKDVVVFEEVLREGGLCRPETLPLFLKSLSHLKSLSLKYCKVSGEDIKLFLGNCPLLEVLIIGTAQLTSDLEICGATTLVLNHLEVYCFSRNHSIKVSAPSITWLKINESFGKVILENAPKLVGADITFPYRGANVVKGFASAVFCFSSQLKVLNLTFRSKIYFDDAFPQLPNLKKLVVGYSGFKSQCLLPVTTLIWASPRLEEFKLVYTKISDAISREVIRNIERSPSHQFLKVFQLDGFLGVGDHIDLVTYISDNCVALEKIIIGCSPISAFSYDFILDPYEDGNAYRKMREDAMAYAKQRLEAKLPQHIQLQLVR